MSDGFLGRWARRKLEVKREELARLEKSAPQAQALNPTSTETTSPSNESLRSEADVSQSGPHLGVVPGDSNPQGVQQGAEPMVMPTEADLDAVAQGGEIRGFMNPQVSGDLRNKAFKALFSQPQFNQMDFMDVYVDDYSVSKPLTSAMIDMMALGKQLLSRPDLEPKPEAVAELAPDTATHEPSETELLSEPTDGLLSPIMVPTELPVEQDAVVKNEND